MNKKILILSFSFSKTGGIEQVANDVYNSLKDQYDIKAVALDEFDIFKINRLNNIYRKFAFNRNICRAFDRQPDIIISMHPFLFKNLSLKNRYKLVTWVHGIEVFGKNGIEQKERLEKCDLIVSVSSFTKKHLIELGYPPNKIKVINNCVNIDRFKHSPLTVDSISPNTFNILTTGRLAKTEQYKGHDIVILSLKLALELTDKNIQYTIVGDGDDIERLKKLAINENVDEHVMFVGKVSFKKLLEAYNSSDLLVMPSFFKRKENGTYTGEGFGIVYIEAGSIGRPVIGCKVGGQTDCIIDGYNGKLADPTPESVAQHIAFFANNYDEVIRMGYNNRKLVETKFSFELFKKNVNEMIESI